MKGQSETSLVIRNTRPAIQTVTLQRQDVVFHHGDTEGTEISQRFSVHLRVLRVSVVNEVLEFLLISAFHNTPGSHKHASLELAGLLVPL